MTMIDMKGLDFNRGPEGGIYLMQNDTSAEQVARGGGGMGPGHLKSQKIKGWDGGRFIPGDTKTTADALAATGLDWLVDRHPVIKVDPIWGVEEDGTPAIIGWEPRRTDEPLKYRKGQQKNGLPTGGFDVVPSETMNVRRDTGDCLGIVGPGWTGPQNHEAFSFVDDLVDSGNAKWLAGGERHGGAKIWMCAQLDRGTILGGDENEMSVPLLFFTNGWDGTTNLQITVAPYRLACLNGQTIPLEGFARTWKARHTRNLTEDGRLAEARDTLALSIGYFDAWAKEMEHLMAQPLATKQVESVIRKLFPTPAPDKDGKERKRLVALTEEKRADVLTIFRNEPDLQNLKRSKYRLLNAVTAYADWYVKAPEDQQMLRSGEPSPLKDKAYALLAAA